ncbi:PepSY domain-containing protein [Pseudomonas sp. 5P_3.1_Bac2]|uniref:PepSY domain-containing protein n=1 Tax=Pseudomonas sp. 5P_3.1_Bac2 TaxID=2971617 RepID=UPI0021C58B9D|nr:PepSY domain-containing protein [Pseudomonas sp. 5P_3.1_Bac2]MCU1717739.1 PepSY domain-containing protein [Pseudomonas sp. 5P_3.1_Bac2]
MKRQLYLWHRWLGIIGCLFMALWLVSGVVMLYVGYPKLTPSERLSHLPRLSADCCQDLPSNWIHRPLKSLRLTSLGGQPHYLMEQLDGRRFAVNARTGEQIMQVDQAWALANAQQYLPGIPLHYQRVLDEDMWSHSRALDDDRPLHLVRAEDGAGTWLYLSGRTGELVRDASHEERVWNWVGAWLHWLYPLRGGFGFENGWRVLVIGLSLLGTLMAVLGMLVGVLRLRWRSTYRNGSHSPYKGGWLRWHHIGGLLFGLVLVLWVFSGLMSMRPWGLTLNQSKIDLNALGQSPLRASEAPVSVAQALTSLQQNGEFAAVELEWRRLAGETYLLARDASGDSRIIEGNGKPLLSFSRERLLAAAQPLANGLRLKDNWQTQYDFHYFARAEHSMLGGMPRPLPVLRLRFNDAAQSWLYLDPASGELVASHDQAQRSGRWLFNLLHSWDGQALLQRPRLREGLMIAFSLGSLVIASSGVVLAWRRLRRSKPRRAKARE